MQNEKRYRLYSTRLVTLFVNYSYRSHRVLGFRPLWRKYPRPHIRAAPQSRSAPIASGRIIPLHRNRCLCTPYEFLTGLAPVCAPSLDGNDLRHWGGQGNRILSCPRYHLQQVTQGNRIMNFQQ